MKEARASGQPGRALLLQSRQRVCQVDLRRLRRIVAAAIAALPAEPKLNRPAGLSASAAQACELGICLVAAREMSRINETYLRHRGSTDVLTFDYSADPATGGWLGGEIFVCVDEAISQGRRLRTGWPSELVRYVVHGLLHLQGFDDHHPAARRQMKLEENRLLRRLARRFDFSQLERLPRTKVGPKKARQPLMETNDQR